MQLGWIKRLGLLPFLLLAIALGIVIGSFSPLPVIRLLATFNGVFGGFLGFIVPLLIIAFVAPGIGDLGKNGGKLLGLTVLVAYVSTVLAGTIGYFTNVAIFPLFVHEGALHLADTTNPEHLLATPYLSIAIDPMLSVISALVLSFILGLGINAVKGDVLKRGLHEFQHIISLVITKLIIPLLPLHILGVFANMTYAGQVATILHVFAGVFAVIIGLHISVILIQYLIACAIAKKNPFHAIKEMLPAYFTAIGTQSSAATIPVTINCMKKAGISEKIANFVAPLCANIHMSGSILTISGCCLAVLMLNGQPYSFGVIFPFIMMLAIGTLAGPGVPGGAVMASIGFVQSMLGFNDPLIALLIALYIAQDSFGTACNVTGDGAIAIMIDTFANKTK